MKPYAEWGDWHNRDLKSWWRWAWDSGPGAWEKLARCTGCGCAYPRLGQKVNGIEVTVHPNTKENPWLCEVCGSDSTALVYWVGREYPYRGRADRVLNDRSERRLVEWQHPDRMPKDLLPKDTETSFDKAVREAVERELPKRLDAEFEARVRAAVEVELTTMKGGDR